MPRKDDNARRAIAEKINERRTHWLVVWGCYSRLYWAYPLFAMRPRKIVYAVDPDALVVGMDEAERRFRIWPEGEGE
jgi:hypothetical protein